MPSKTLYSINRVSYLIEASKIQFTVLCSLKQRKKTRNITCLDLGLGIRGFITGGFCLFTARLLDKEVFFEYLLIVSRTFAEGTTGSFLLDDT